MKQWACVAAIVTLSWLSAYSEGTQAGTGFIQVSLPANDLVYDAARHLIWASIPSSSEQYGNTVVAIDPASGSIRGSIPIDGDPTRLALSGDGSRLFVISPSSADIRVLDPDALIEAQVFSVTDTGTWIPTALVALPGTADSVVVAASGYGYERQVVVLDGGIPRTQAFTNVHPNGFADPTFGIDALFPGSQPDLFYGSNSQLQSGDGRHSLYNFRIDSNGIHLVEELSPLAFDRFGTGLVYDAGRLFTSAGEVWSSDTSQLLGVLGLNGLPVALGDADTVGYVDWDRLGYQHRVVVTTFDRHTLRPLTRLHVDSPRPPPHPEPTAVVAVGRAVVAVSTTVNIIVVPLASLARWPDHTPRAEVVAPGVQRIALPVNAIAAQPATGKVLLATPNTAGHIGNSVITFNPETGRMEAETFVGSEPSILVASEDGLRAYAYLQGERRIAGVDLSLGTRDLLFATDPTGGGAQYEIVDFALSRAGDLAVSYIGGTIAVFDNGRPRPTVNWNSGGAFATTSIPGTLSAGPTRQRIEFDDTGTRLYASNFYWSLAEFERFAISPDGIEWLSSIGELVGNADMRYADGHVYTTRGSVIDPERLRRVASFDLKRHSERAAVLPDPAARRVYIASGNEIVLFDMDTYAKIGSIVLPSASPSYLHVPGLAKFSGSGLAFHASDNEVFLIDTTLIPLEPTPISSPQTTFSSTPGVRVFDIDVEDMEYDFARGLIYATTPNSEGILGDQVIAVNPETGTFVPLLEDEPDLRLLSLSDDSNRLYYTAGRIANETASNYSFTSEYIRQVDLASRATTPAFANVPPDPSAYLTPGGIVHHQSSRILDLEVLPGRSDSVAVLRVTDALVEREDDCCWYFHGGPSELSIFDSGLQRPDAAQTQQLGCTSIEFDNDASRLYCGVPPNPLRLGSRGTLVVYAPNENGVPPAPIESMELDTNPFELRLGAGRIVTTNGSVLRSEPLELLAELPVDGNVAVSDRQFHWLRHGPDERTLTLLSYDVATLQQVVVRSIKVKSTEVDQFIACGTSCLAFTSGRELYLVDVGNTASIPGVSPVEAADGGGMSRVWDTGEGTATGVGYAILEPILDNRPVPDGLAILGFRRDGVLASEASVPAAEPLTSGRIYAEVNGPVNTGLAVLNPNDQPATLSFYFTDASGAFGRGTTSIPAHGQIVRFLDETPFNGTPGTRASFTFHSSVAVSAIALRTWSNPRGESVITTLPVLNLNTAVDSEPTGVPHFAAGSGWTTDVILVNTDRFAMNGIIEFVDPSGQPIAVNVDGVSSANFEYSIPAEASQKFTASASTSVLTGSVRVKPPYGMQAPVALSIFSLMRDGVVVAAAGLPESEKGTRFRLYAEIQGNLGSPGSTETAVAVANMSANPTTVTVEVNSLDGRSDTRTGTLIVPANGQAALHLRDIPGLESLESPFEGLARVSSSAPISVTALRVRFNERGDYLIVATPPIRESYLYYWPRYFPYIVGGTNTTQLIFLSDYPGTSYSGELHLYSQSGERLDVSLH